MEMRLPAERPAQGGAGQAAASKREGSHQWVLGLQLVAFSMLKVIVGVDVAALLSDGMDSSRTSAPRRLGEVRHPTALPHLASTHPKPSAGLHRSAPTPPRQHRLTGGFEQTGPLPLIGTCLITALSLYNGTSSFRSTREKYK